jgi:hypothetical protein
VGRPTPSRCRQYEIDALGIADETLEADGIKGLDF